MRKFFTIMLVAMISLVAVSCDDRNDDVVVTDNDTYAVMKDITGSLTSSNTFALTQGIDIPPTDVVLV